MRIYDILFEEDNEGGGEHVEDTLFENGRDVNVPCDQVSPAENIIVMETQADEVDDLAFL